MDNTENLTMLGGITAQPQDPATAPLELIPWAGRATIARCTCPEFTSLCPVTSQPDFATIVIDYMPRAHLVESKALKLYLGSFRNHGAFHESCTSMIFERLVAELSPVWMRVAAFFLPRGGIPIDVFCEMGRLPGGVDKPYLSMRSYRGR
jgi:7-cyano-7-deazaguanine reductase